MKCWVDDEIILGLRVEMGLKNRLQHKGNLEEEFGRQTGGYESHLHWETHLQLCAANRSSNLRPSHSPVSLDPLPSFLTQTPLGTPCEEIVDLEPLAEIPVEEKQKGRNPSVPLPRQTVEQVREAPKRFQQKTGRRKKPVKSYQGARAFGFIHHWVYEEVRLSMSKMSIVSLVLGLLFLGTLFFIIGFLAAVATIEPSTEGGSSSSAWQASNTHEKGGGKGFGRALNAVGGGIVGKAVGSQLGPFEKAIGSSSVIPKSLQPFARYGMGRGNAEVRRDVRQVNPFVHHRRGRAPAPTPAPEQQPYGAQQPGGTQQYAPPYGGSQVGQAYGPPGAFPAPVGYQQPAAFSQTGQVQGGYNQGYAPPQQQQMMQQPYYQQPMQQQAYQQPMAPQQMMVPQQQMMPEPQYQQQMPPQQGYYR